MFIYRLNSFLIWFNFLIIYSVSLTEQSFDGKISLIWDIIKFKKILKRKSIYVLN